MRLTVDRHNLTDDHVRMLGADTIRRENPLADACALAFSFRRRDLDDVAWYAARQAVADAWNARVAELGDGADALLDDLDRVIVDRLELDLAQLLRSRSGRPDPGVDAWLAYDPAQDAWRVAATVRSVPLGELVMGIDVDEGAPGVEIRRRIAHAMRDLRSTAGAPRREPRRSVDAPAP